MIVIAYLPVLSAVVGLILYFVSTNGKVQRVGEILFFCGVLAFLLTQGNASSVVRIGK
jgi:hypothetical protein